MGPLLSSGFGRDRFRPDHGHRFGPGRTSFSVQPCEHRKLRWPHGRLVDLLAPTNHPCCRYARRYRTLFGDSRTSWSAKAEHRRSKGELAIGRGSSRHNLVFGRSRGGLTMMQSCASAAKLRGGGPILRNGATQWSASGDRHLGSSSETDGILFARFRELVLPAFSRHAARKTTPAGTSPVVTIRHRAISSFLARATIRVLRVPPWASAVRARYHCARALSFWNRRKRQASWIIPRRTRALPALASPFSRRRLPLSSGEPVRPA